MPNVWDKTPPAPPPELNPLRNPLLEQNLGRWAKIYFSTPPAKREEAINHLLEEIKHESGAAASGRPYFATDVRFQRAVCAVCQHHNPPGHKFCSRCGQTLSPVQQASPEHQSTTGTPAPLPRASVADVPWLREWAFSGLSDTYPPPRRGWKYVVGVVVIALAGFAYVRWHPELWTKVATTGTPQVNAPAPALPSPVEAPAEPKVPAETIAPKSVAPESPAEPKVPAETIAPKSVAPESPAEPKVPAETIAPKSVAPESPPPQYQGRATEDPSATAEARHRTSAPSGIQPATSKSSLLDVAPRQTVTEQGSGASDVHLAQRYLGGSMGVRDPSEAAKLLWKAVSKQNATAAVLLSDLYLRGDGVPRSCDQARLLLVAAAKRGSPLAAQQLRNFESRGCR